MFSTLPVILCWVIIATATNHWSLLIGRFLGGMSTGLMGAASQVRSQHYKIQVKSKSPQTVWRRNFDNRCNKHSCFDDMVVSSH